MIYTVYIIMSGWKLYGVRSAGVVVLLLLLCWQQEQVRCQSSSRVPALFVFGDSLVEVGNNNFLMTLARANYFPYGIDFNGPTGRFSNGKSFIDFIGDLLGIPSPPAFANPMSVGDAILHGVNYASANGGILQESGRHYGERYSLSQQVQNFEKTLSQYRSVMNEGPTTTQFLAKSIAVIVIGNSDYVNNYLSPALYGSSSNYTAPQFANLLLNNLVQHVMRLHSLGLRKFFVAGIGPLGCIPNQRAAGSAPPGRCVDSVNQIVGGFNEGLRSAVDQLNRNHPDAMFLYGNTYGILGDILNNPAAYSFSVIDRACCGIGLDGGQISCLPLQIPCLLRNQYVFWDAFHPTQSAVYVLAWRVVRGPPNDSYPINIQQLAQL